MSWTTITIHIQGVGGAASVTLERSQCASRLRPARWVDMAADRGKAGRVGHPRQTIPTGQRVGRYGLARAAMIPAICLALAIVAPVCAAIWNLE